MQNHNKDTTKTTTQSFRKIYLSLYLKGLCVRGSWIPNRPATYWPPQSYGHQRCVSLVLWGCSTGGLGSQLSAECWLSLPFLVSKLTDFQSSPNYIIVPCPPSCGRHNRTHSTRPRSRLYSDIPWADAPVIYIGAFPILTARPGRRSIYNITSLK